MIPSNLGDLSSFQEYLMRIFRSSPDTLKELPGRSEDWFCRRAAWHCCATWPQQSFRWAQGLPQTRLYCRDHKLKDDFSSSCVVEPSIMCKWWWWKCVWQMQNKKLRWIFPSVRLSFRFQEEGHRKNDVVIWSYKTCHSFSHLDETKAF